MSNTASTSHGTYAPSRATVRVRTLAISALAALAATLITLSVTDDAPSTSAVSDRVGTATAERDPGTASRAAERSGTAATHDSGIAQRLRESSSGQHDSGIAQLLRDRAGG